MPTITVALADKDWQQNHIFTYMIFIYSYSYIFTIIGYMTNSQLTIYPCGLIAQWMEHCTGIARSWVRVPFKPDFFQVAFSTA